MHNVIRLNPLNMDFVQITIRPLKQLGSGQTHIVITIICNLAAIQNESSIKIKNKVETISVNTPIAYIICVL